MRLLLVLLLLLAPMAARAEDLGPRPEVPEGVRLTLPDADEEEAAADLLRRGLTGGTGDLFGSVVLVGPFLWQRLADQPGFQSLEGPPLHVVVPRVEGSMVALGRALKTPQATASLQQTLQADSVKVRRLTAAELTLLWALVAYDLDGPILVAETGDHRYVVHFQGGQPMMVDDYGAAGATLEEGFEALAALPGTENEPSPRPDLVADGRLAERVAKEDKTAVLLVTDQDMVGARVALDPLSDYVDALDAAVRKAAPAGSRVLLQVDLAAGKPPLLRAAGLEAETLQDLEAPPVKGPVCFILVVPVK